MSESLITGNKSYADVTADILRPLLHKPGRLWYLGMILSLGGLAFGLIATYNTLFYGIGDWGLDRTIGWGWAITNFVWWIGIGHAGTFISAILLLFEQRWRNSINRAAEAMTIIAILCAAFFPVIHMGRVFLGFFIFPYFNTRNLWVNFNSPLLWDVFAISTYFIVSLLFWYTGLIPDLALLAEKVKRKTSRLIYRKLSINWTGSSRNWYNHGLLTWIMAGIATPLVISVHSIVSMDFATSIVPGWHSTIFPPYFVAGAIFSGFAMVQTLLIITRKMLHLEDYITRRHFENMNKIILVTGLIVAAAYFSEIILAFYSGDEFEIYAILNRMTGPYAPYFWVMLCCNVLIPQLLWVKKLRRSLTFAFFASILINVGMWLERYVIVVASLHRDHLPSAWSVFHPTLTDIGLLVGSFGFFFAVFLLFVRIFPIISIYEVKHLIHENKNHAI